MPSFIAAHAMLATVVAGAGAVWVSGAAPGPALPRGGMGSEPGWSGILSGAGEKAVTVIL